MHQSNSLLNLCFCITTFRHLSGIFDICSSESFYIIPSYSSLRGSPDIWNRGSNMGDPGEWFIVILLWIFLTSGLGQDIFCSELNDLRKIKMAIFAALWDLWISEIFLTSVGESGCESVTTKFGYRGALISARLCRCLEVSDRHWQPLNLLIGFGTLFQTTTTNIATPGNGPWRSLADSTHIHMESTH